jgi:capsular exopolysaccharide synthesis family protein
MTVLSLLSGFALVFVLERLDNAVRSTDQLEYLTGLPTLAVIPALRSSPKDMRTELLEHPRSALADSIRGLRIAVDLNADWTGKGQRGRVVAITSSVPKEGKTFLAMCLAIMCARTDKRVLLIDGDIHRPRLHTMVNLPNEMGLVQILAGTHKADDIIVRDIAPGLDFLPAGQMSNVTDLVDEAGTGALLKDLSAKYHWVVMDLPPVLAVADTRIMTRLADHVIYLVRWNSATRDAVRNGIKLLREARAPIFGVVLSQVNQRKHARYAYGDYGHYYGRYRDYYAE